MCGEWTQLPTRTIDIDYSSNLGVSPKTSNLFVLLLLHVDSISIHSLKREIYSLIQFYSPESLIVGSYNDGSHFLSQLETFIP